LVLDIESVGESAAFISGESTYRELPLIWVLRQLQRMPDWSVVATKEFQMKLSSKSLKKQINYAKRTAKRIVDAEFQKAFLTRIKHLEDELRSWSGKHTTNAKNYAIVAKRRITE